MKKLTLLIGFFALVGCGNEDGAKIVDWIAHNDPMIDSDWNPIIEELYYSFEVL